MPVVKFIKEKVEVEVAPGENVRTAAQRAGIEVHVGIRRWLNCRGLGLCAGCRVLIRQGGENVSPQGLWERFNILRHPMACFHRIGYEKEFRLACLTKVFGDVDVETQPDFNWHGEKFWR
ncbi:MAG: (2Fe-2S)-binding protein [Planctomycetes bacterium]|nr:(2Fe-2S)-binding protein [Planctomycetota bacterium]